MVKVEIILIQKEDMVGVTVSKIAYGDKTEQEERFADFLKKATDQLVDKIIEEYKPKSEKVD